MARRRYEVPVPAGALTGISHETGKQLWLLEAHLSSH